jgi:GxxExxY protein
VNNELIHRDETYQILGACFEVYRDKGCGFLEGVFQECLQIEFELRNIPARSQVSMTLEYKERPLRQSYVADFICYEKVILELKAVSKLTDEHRPSTKLPQCDKTAGRSAREFWPLSKDRT